LQDCGSWLGVNGCIFRGELHYGLLYTDTYNALSDQGKEMVQVFAQSNEQIAFHNLLVGRNAMQHKDALQALLLGMHEDAKGKEVLGELEISQWLASSEEDLTDLRTLVAKYSG
jgi:ABC-type phosphate/phosphonate transport system substrate-binding protein